MGMKRVFAVLIEAIFTLTCISEITASPREFEVPAVNYINKYGPLELGQCPKRIKQDNHGNDVIVQCPRSIRYQGTQEFLPIRMSRMQIKRVTSARDLKTLLDVTGGAGLSLGIGFLKLASVSVSVRVVQTMRRKTNSLTLYSSYTGYQGVYTLRDARPPKNAFFTDDDPRYYLSETELGSKETLLVQVDFESLHKKRIVEITITIKILFVKISKKLRFIKESFNSNYRVEVTRLSSRAGVRSRHHVFEGHQFEEAIRKVEEYEDEFKRMPKELERVPKRELHMKYHFALWDTTHKRYRLNSARARFIFENIGFHIDELTLVTETIRERLRQLQNGPFKRELQVLGDEVKTKLNQLKNKKSAFFELSESEILSIPDVYGRQKAPYYFKRKLNSIVKRFGRENDMALLI